MSEKLLHHPRSVYQTENKQKYIKAPAKTFERYLKH